MGPQPRITNGSHGVEIAGFCHTDALGFQCADGAWRTRGAMDMADRPEKTPEEYRACIEDWKDYEARATEELKRLRGERNEALRLLAAAVDLMHGILAFGERA